MDLAHGESGLASNALRSSGWEVEVYIVRKEEAYRDHN